MGFLPFGEEAGGKKMDAGKASEGTEIPGKAKKKKREHGLFQT